MRARPESAARRTIVSRHEDETRALGLRLGKAAEPGDVICLKGPLGSGKTTFVQGFAQGAGFKGKTASPTFGLLRQYRAKRVTIYHADFFRLAEKDLPNLGIEEWLADPKGVCLIEWPEIVGGLLPEDRLEIEFAHREDGGRDLAVTIRGPRSSRLLK